MTRRDILRIGAGLAAAAAAFELTGCSTGKSSPTISSAPSPSETLKTPDTTPGTDPLSSQNLWGATQEQRLDLFRSLLPESIIKQPEEFVKTKVEITAALYNMVGDQEQFNEWVVARKASGQAYTNQQYADYVYGLIIEPALTLLDGRTPTGDNRQGILNMAARAGFVVAQQYEIDTMTGGTKFKLPRFEYSYNFTSITPKNATDTSFDVDVKVIEGDNITKDTVDKVYSATGLRWGIDTNVGGTLAFTWKGVHFDPKTRIALPKESLVTTSG